MALPGYLRKKRELELDEGDNFYNQALKNTLANGTPDITDFLTQVNAKAEEIKRKQEEADAKALEEIDDHKLRKKREQAR